MIIVGVRMDPVGGIRVDLGGRECVPQVVSCGAPFS